MGIEPSVESTQAAIAQKAEYLYRRGGEKLDWASLPLGRLSLRVRRIRLNWRTTRTVYELDHISLLDESTDQYSSRRYIFTEEGLIAGVVRSRIDSAGPDFTSVEDSMRFQVKEGLFAPLDEDYEALERVLESGLINAPIERLSIDE